MRGLRSRSPLVKVLMHTTLVRLLLAATAVLAFGNYVVAQRQITSNPANDTDVRFSPDGQSIAFVSDRDGDLDVFVMDVDGGNARNVSDHPENDGFPSWSPDGSLIAFESSRSGSFEVFVMPADGGGPTNLTGDEGGRFPAWSPDGSQIAFVRELGRNPEIFVMNADGSDVRRLTDSPAIDFEPEWSPSDRPRRAPAWTYALRVDQRGVTPGVGVRGWITDASKGRGLHKLVPHRTVLRVVEDSNLRPATR